MMRSSIIIAAISLMVGAGLGYYFGYDIGFEKAIVSNIDSFDECVAAGYPVAESYPEQCRTLDGRLFVRNIGQDAVPSIPNYPTEGACTMEAKLCPDGSSVGRVAPECDFAPCPGE